MSFIKRTISLLLALCMIGFVLPFAAFADQEDDFSCVHVMGEDGNCRECGETLVAVNDKGAYFSSLQRAIDASGNIRLLQTVIPDDNTAVTVRSGNSVTLDLNGKKLGGDEDGCLLSVNNFGSFTLTDSSDNKGELHGGIYTKGYEVRDPETDEVTESAYGASTVIVGGRIYGDVTAEHDEGRGYFVSEVKPNPAVTVNGGYFIGGHMSVPDDMRGIIKINAGCFTVEPPHKFVKSGFEAEYDGRYYSIVAARYFAGLKEPLLLAADLSGRARTAAISNSAVSGFITDDLLDVSEIMRQNAIAFDESTSLKSALYINAVSADVHGDGESAIVTGMEFAVSPLLYVYHGGEYMELSGDWKNITTDNSDGGITVRLPVDSRLTCGSVSFSTCSRTVNLDVLSKNGEKYIQVFVSGYELDSGVSYSAVINEECAVTYNGCGGVCNADGAELRTETLTVNGKDDIVLKDNIYEREHYSFSGWNYNGSLYQPGDIYPFIIGDMTFDAEWTPERYEITYVLNGGENSRLNISSYDFDTCFTLSEPSREGAVFAGWYDNADFGGEPVSAISAGEYGDRTFYAKWNLEIRIEVNGNGSGVVSDRSGVFENGSVIKLPMGSDLSVDFFADVENGSYIDWVRINGDTIGAVGHYEAKNLTEGLTVEVCFSSASVADSQISDISAIAEMNRVRETFENEKVSAFAETGVGAAIDISDLKETSLISEDGDIVLCSVNVIFRGVFYRADGSMITGFEFDAEPAVAVISKYGVLKASEPVSTELVKAPVHIRIPVDSSAYLRYAAAYCGEELLGYFRTEGESDSRYVDVVTEKLENLTVILVDGRANDPVCAIGTKGYISIDDAIAHADVGDVIYVFSSECGVQVPGGISGIRILDAFSVNPDLKSVVQELDEKDIDVDNEILPDEEVFLERTGNTLSAMLGSSPEKTKKSVAKLIHEGTEIYYDTFAEAYKASAEGDTLMLLKPIKISSSNPEVTYRIKYNLTIDLNGNKIVCDNPALTVFTVNDGAEFTLRNGEIDATGTAVRLGKGSILNLSDTCAVTGVIDEGEGKVNNVVSTIYTVTFDPNGGYFPTFSGSVSAEVGSYLDEPEKPVNSNHSAFVGWYTDQACTAKWNFASDTVPDKDMTLYAKWGHIAYIEETGVYYYSLKDAYDDAEERQKIVLVYSTTEDVVFNKREILLDLNGFSYINSSGVVFADNPSAFKDSDHVILKYTEDGRTKYQVRKQYPVTYHFGTSVSAIETNSVNNKSAYFFDKDVTIFNPRKIRADSSGSNKSAFFGGWYYDKKLSEPTKINGTVEKTKVSVLNCTIPAVPAPEWPENIDLYPRWLWSISAYSNNYGYIECNGTRIRSGTIYYFDEGETPKYTFHPRDGYKVYRATIRDYRTTKENDMYSYVPSYWDKHEGDQDYRDYGLQINTTIVVTFARGYYNPMTGDDSSIRIWVCLMCASLAVMSGAVVVSRRRKKR